MLALAFFQWWYGPGWLRLLRGIGETVLRVIRTFSVPTLLRTLIAPWRRIITYGGESFIDGLKAMLDNAVSRAVGFGVRTIVLVTAALLVTIIGVLGLALLVIWPVLPLAAVFLIGRGLLP
ncbi:MAG TPA: hypothetical protein VMR98_05130 [Candidatus Polarisedimenticolaceae bacterium]|nr:hypothetical protein [Candidatus Polarisedimenticolaceae bacterium]